jgi:hypothetical protein
MKDLKEFIELRLAFLEADMAWRDNMRGTNTTLMIREYKALLEFITKQEEKDRLGIHAHNHVVRMIEEGRLGPHVECDVFRHE